jgi:ferric-dicitrate binding protein FerR (iron transport regulator)
VGAPKPIAKTPANPLRRVFFGGSVAIAVAAAAAIGIYMSGKSDDKTAVVDAPWSGKVSAVSRASADKAGGLVACNPAGSCAPVEAGAAIAPGTSLRTDTRTRAHVELADGTKLALDRGSSVELTAKEKRALRIEKGAMVADVASTKQGPPARFLLPQGEVEVLGTLLSITASEERASVEVARGAVRVTGRSGGSVEVRAGEEATLGQRGEPSVASATSLADVLEWSDRSPEEVDAPVLRGLGELRARKPGQTKEREAAVRLAKHSVKVRIVDMVARTEVDETFANDTDEELEGIFRFPLPPGAQIEKLALEVDGKLLDGAFVDRDRGAAIWRGVIQNAAPKAPKPREEIVWVPGPWRDPALLEWQRGGRFELRIFPIPKRGSRRVVLTYTELVTQAGGIRRFTYPLAHDSSGTTKIDAFDLDVQVLGLDKEQGLQARGYELASAPSPDASAERRTLTANGFTPAGDLTVEYALPDRTKEVSAWAYQAAAPQEPSAPAPGKAKTPEEKAAAETAQAILNDGSPYVALALRPKLPRWKESKERVFAIVVDASRSMVGERFARASRLASAIVREMDRRDSFVLLACDTVCRAMPEGNSDSGRDGRDGRDARGRSAAVAAPMPPGQAAAGNVDRYLGGIEPDGGSDPSAAVSAARAAAGSLRGRELRVLYLGDGTPTVGPIRAAHLETAVRGALPNGEGSVLAIALGADADMTSLAALARGGGGVVVPYVPGQKVVSAALDVLSTAYGVVLRDPEVELPPGLSQVTPARLDPIRAGGETLIVARMTGGSEVSGSIRLRGRILDERFEQTYPVRIAASSSGGNAFVPRLFAAAKIAELEQAGGEVHKSTIIELSKRFAVASRFTSLLVLESEAMFKAFGLDRVSGGPSFTGEEQAQRSEADAEGEEALDEEDAKESAAEPRPAATSAPEKKDEHRPLGLGGGGGFATPPSRAPSRPKVSIPGDPLEDAPGGPFNPAPASPPPPPSQPQPKGKSGCAPSDLLCHMQGAPKKPAPPPLPTPPRPLVAMRKVFDRKGAFEAQNTFVAQNASKLLAAESALTAAPDSRDKTADLYALYATSGRIGEAQELTAKWSNKDALDPDALLARSDLAARQGDRDRATRILGGLADVRPGDKAIHTRMAKLHDAAGNAALACRHRLTLADLAPGDAAFVADAVRCARAQQMGDLASQIKLDAGDKVREAVDRLLIAPAPDASALRGDVQITAEWTGAADLDIALIDEKGKRTSWLGTASKAVVTARDATSTRSETLSVAELGRGSYVLEIALAAGDEAARAANIRGDVTVRLPGGETRKVPFTLSGPRVEVGTLRIFFTSRLVPL